jgi:spore coat polysaccharide biosynthesis protein SpsF
MKKSILGVVQVRMGSTRLKEKAMKSVLGKPVLAVIIDRLKHSQLIDKIVIATTDRPEDKVIMEFACANGLGAYAGSEMDIVDRMYQTAIKYDAEAIIRITGDCPFVDPKIVDQIIALYKNDPELNYVSNIYPPSYPDGLDVELVSFKTLERLKQEVNDPFLREWLAGYIVKNPDKFRTANLKNKSDLSALRWTVDYQEDYEFVSNVFEELGRDGQLFLMQDILQLLDKKPELLQINAGHTRNEAYLSIVAYKEVVENIR